MWAYWVRSVQEAPPWHFILLWLVFLLGAVAIRYGTGFLPEFRQFGGGIIFYALPYFFTLLLYSLCTHSWAYWQARHFWVLSAGILTVLYLNQYISFAQTFGFERAVATRTFYHQIGYNIQSTLLYLLIPLLCGWWFSGAKSTHSSLTPYFLMLLAMMPLLIWASFREDFLATYPRYRPTTAESHLGVSPIWTVGSYEISYILQFISLEVFFRGFIVLALYKYVGNGSIFVMVSVYAFLHFWKPLPETLGSIAGGYILGTLACYSGSVYGGMIIHVGIALMMELLAWWQLYSKGRL